MLDPNMEIRQLRTKLLMRRVPENVIDEVTVLATNEISVAIRDILGAAVEEAISEGEAINAPDFVEQLRAINVGSYFQVTTDSGQTDFSEPPFPMLPSLLKNAKVAKDGSRYKVIPIKDKTVKSRSPSQRVSSKTAMNAMRALDEARRQTAQGKQARLHGERTGSMGMFEQAAKMSGFFNNMKPTAGQKEVPQKDEGPTTNFRVASSKQDPTQKWVNPGKKKDMTETLRRINMDMQSRISSAVRAIISKYESMYAY